MTQGPIKSLGSAPDTDEMTHEKRKVPIHGNWDDIVYLHAIEGYQRGGYEIYAASRSDCGELGYARYAYLLSLVTFYTPYAFFPL